MPENDKTTPPPSTDAQPGAGSSNPNFLRAFSDRMFTQKDPKLAEKEKQAALLEAQEKEKQEKQTTLEAQEKVRQEAAKLEEEERAKAEEIDQLRKRRLQLQNELRNAPKESTEENSSQKKREEAERVQEQLTKLRKDVAKKKIAERDASTLKNLGADDAQKLTSKTKAILLTIGLVASTFYILAWAFPAFSVIITALAIGVLVSATAYFAYKAYIKGSNAIRQVGDILTKIEGETIPELQTSAELAIDSSKEAAIEATHTLKQFQEDTHVIRETVSGAKDVSEKMATLIDTATKATTDFSTKLDESTIYIKVQIDQLRMLTRQSFALTGNIYPHTLIGVSYDELQSKTKSQCKTAGMASKNTAFIALKPGSNTEIVCRFINDQGTINNITIEDRSFAQKPITKIAKDHSEMILETINLYIIHINNQRGMTAYKKEMAAANPAAPAPTVTTATPSSPSVTRTPATSSTKTEGSPDLLPERRRPSVHD